MPGRSAEAGTCYLRALLTGIRDADDHYPVQPEAFYGPDRHATGVIRQCSKDQPAFDTLLQHISAMSTLLPDGESETKYRRHLCAARSDRAEVKPAESARLYLRVVSVFGVLGGVPGAGEAVGAPEALAPGGLPLSPSAPVPGTVGAAGPGAPGTIVVGAGGAGGALGAGGLPLLPSTPVPGTVGAAGPGAPGTTVVGAGGEGGALDAVEAGEAGGLGAPGAAPAGAVGAAVVAAVAGAGAAVDAAGADTPSAGCC